jgi:ribonucleoside-diphosphate reductase alpha chain
MKNLPKNAHDIMVKRYALRNEKNEPVETPKDILARSARIVAQAENNFRDGITPQQVEAKYLDLLSDFRFLPNGRTLANAGTGSAQLANCFVLPLEDDLGKTEDGIFSILRKAVLVLQSGGGVGFSFGRIRPKGDSAGRGKATGAVSFIKVFDTAFWIIGQGGGRRSACMAVLPVWHPDIEDFIKCKKQERVIEHFNISVAITDEFMKAVEGDKPFNLINPRNKEVWKTVRARDLFNLIVEHAHHNGEPGVLFIDAANRDNPVPHQYYLEATNPCGEQWLGPYENCCMASINLAEHASPTKNGDLFSKQIDWHKLKETVVWTVRWLDDVIEANDYVPAIPELKEAAQKNRRIGVSIMGLADLYYKLGIRYGSTKGVELAGQIMEFIRYESMRASIQLARERGAFPGIVGSIYDYTKDPTDFWGKAIPTRRNWTAPKTTTSKNQFNRPPIDWKQLIKDLKIHGIRNSCQTTIQPTGAIATISGLEGYGCEPVFALSYIMKTHEGAHEHDQGEWAELYYESKHFSQTLKKAGLSKKVRDHIFTAVRAKGTCQHVNEVPKEIRDVFAVSSDIAVSEHVAMQAALQTFTDNAISKTVNFPASATTKDVAKAYLDGWKKGLKGMTVYVTGSRQKVVLETTQTRDKKEEPTEPFASESGITGKPLHKVHHDDSNCPECGEAMVLAEGCMHCPACGYAKCDT